MDRTNQAFDTISDNLVSIRAKTTEFAAGLLEKVAPALADLTTRLANIDAAGFGAKLSGYLESTLAWMASTFRLGEALDQIEVAINGITSGDFGGGLSLMFMTARDTALNAINTIVAAASAAISSVSGAISQMFDSNGALVLLLKTSFTIAANYFKEALFDALAQFMDAIGRGGMADTFRYQAETAAQSIEMLTGSIGAQIEEVGEQAKTVFAGIPAAFKNAYKENLENPLIDMKDRTAETAAQMEKVAAATRSAAFDAEKFGNALAEARLDRLTGDVPSSPRPDNDPAPGIFGMDPKDIPAPSPSAPSPSGRGGGADPKPKTAMDRIRNAASKFDVDAMTEESRMRSRGARGLARADELEDAGMHRSAAQARAREERRRERDAQKFEDRQAKNARREELEKMGPMERGHEEQKERALARAQEKMAKEGSKTEKEREREAKEAERQGGGGGGAASQDPATEATLKQLVEKIQERPILVA